MRLVFLLSSDDPGPWDPRDPVAVEPSLCPSIFQDPHSKRLVRAMRTSGTGNGLSQNGYGETETTVLRVLLPQKALRLPSSASQSSLQHSQAFQVVAALLARRASRCGLESVGKMYTLGDQRVLLVAGATTSW